MNPHFKMEKPAKQKRHRLLAKSAGGTQGGVDQLTLAVLLLCTPLGIRTDGRKVVPRVAEYRLVASRVFVP